MRQCARDLQVPILSTPGRVLLPDEWGTVAQIHSSGYHAVVITSLGKVVTLGRGVGSTTYDGIADEEAADGDDSDLVLDAKMHGDSLVEEDGSFQMGDEEVDFADGLDE